MSDPLAVLVIDDSDIARARLLEIVERAGHRAVGRDTAIGASAVIIHEEIDVVVLDIDIPVMNGSTFARILRNNPRMAHVGLILISGDDGRLRSAAAEVAHDAALTKSDVDQDLGAVLDALRRRSPALSYAISVGTVRFFLPRGQVVRVGRAATCDIVVDDPEASREHLALEVDEEGLWVSDLGSKHGVLVNGAPTTGRTSLGLGDILKLGSTLLRVVDGLDTQPTRVTQEFEVVERGE